jgi:LPS sulfotransferase NodH
VLFVFYEDMKADLTAVVRTVAKFIGIDADDALVDTVAKQASFVRSELMFVRRNHNSFAFVRSVCV